MDAALKENQDGWSLLGGMASAFQATIPINVVSLKGSADNAIGGGISHSSGDRNITADSQQNLHDRVQQSTSYIRSLQSAVIVHASQTEQNFLQTRRIANHNHCHALTVQYYEVLRQYRLRTEFVRRRKVVLIPFSPFAFDWQLALRFQTILEQVLADSSLKDCFAALVRLHMVAGIYDPSAGGSTAGGGNGSGSPPTTTSTPIKLLGTDSGKDTGIQLHKGDTLHLYRDANDKQNIHFSSALATDYADPHGEDKPADFNFTAPDLRRHSLVFKIGDAGPWQQGDIDTPSYTADRDGPLILAFNDDNYSDNGDYWALHVDVTSTFTGGTTSGGPSTVPPPAYTQVGDEVCEARLLQHLNGNRGFYLRAVWMLIDSAQRRMLLDHRIPDSILDYTDDVPLAVSGNTVAFPFNGPLSGWTEIRDDDPKLPHEDIVALPTRGLFAEAQLGHCNSCEQRDVTRMWDWTQMTTETPPEIQSIQPGPKGQPEPVPQPATMPTPVVQITQPPAAPDPVGLAAAMKVLGTPNIFRDMSGMAQVSSLLNGLASGSISLDQAQSMAKSAKAQLASDSGAGGGGGTSGATRPQNAGDLYDKMQVIDAAKKQFGLSDSATRQAAMQYFNSDATAAGSVIPAAYGGGVSGAGPATKPPTSLLNAFSKLVPYLGDVATRVGLASESDQLSLALADAAVEIAKNEALKAAADLPYVRVFQLAVRYSMAFAEGVGSVIDAKRAEIQKLVDDAVDFSDNGLTDDDVARLQRARSYQALALPAVVDAIKAGLLSVVQSILDQATGLLSAAAGEITASITGRIAAKLISAAKLDMAYQAIANRVGNDVGATRLEMYKTTAIKLTRTLIASSVGDAAQRTRLEQIVPSSPSEPAPVALLRGLLDIAGAQLAGAVDPLDAVVADIPNDAQDARHSLRQLVQYEAKRAIQALCSELVAAQWTFGSQSSDSDMHVDTAAKTILLPQSISSWPTDAPLLPVGELGLLEDELYTDEAALATIFDGLDVGTVLRAGVYQADIDGSIGVLAQRKYDTGIVNTQNDAAEATSALYGCVRALKDKYSATPLANEADGVLIATPILPPTLRPPPPPPVV